MSAVPMSSVDFSFYPVVRQLRLLDGGDAGCVRSPEARDDPRAEEALSGVRTAVPEARVDVSLADYLAALVGAHICFCCGADVADLGAGPALRCGVCGAEAGVIGAA